MVPKPGLELVVDKQLCAPVIGPPTPIKPFDITLAEARIQIAFEHLAHITDQDARSETTDAED